MAIASVSGLASGVQWRDLIDQIIEAQSSPLTRLYNQQTEIEVQKSAWAAFRSKVAALQTAAAGLADASRLRSTRTTVGNRSSGAAALRASAGAAAEPGTYRIDVLSLAQAEKLGGSSWPSRTAALELSGTVLVNGRELTIAASDSLDQIAQRFNELNAGTSPSGVSASVLATATGSYRLVLTSTSRGSAGMDLRDVSGGLLRALGVVDETATRKHAIAGGAQSAAFSSKDTGLAQLLGLSGEASGTIDIGNGALSLAVDLRNDSLQDVADRINQAGASGISAAVMAETTDGVTSYRLQVTGTTSFRDESGAAILETLGVLAPSRTSAKQQVSTAALTSSGSAATDATALTALDSGIQVGDSISISGTRADGSTFTQTLTVGAGSTMADLLAALNAGTAFGADPANSLRPTATAQLDGLGRIIVSDDVAGDSALALELTIIPGAGGESRELAEVTTTPGRTRVLTAPSDAVLRIDGTYITRSNNEISDAVAGLSLTLSGTGSVDVTVERDTAAATGAITAFVNAYNELASFVSSQTSATGGATPPLYGDTTLRAMQSALRTTLQATLASGVAGSYTRLADLGIEIDRYGSFTIDQTKLTDAVKNRPGDVERFFGIRGVSGHPLLSYVGSTGNTKAGEYDVVITQSAGRAQSTGAAFGSYTQGSEADYLDVTDLGSGRTYSVQLRTGMSAADVASALAAEFGTSTTRLLQSSGDLGAADHSTLLSTLEVDGVNPALAAGEKLVISGSRAYGASFSTSFTVNEGNELGDLLAAIQAQFGSDATVGIVGGRLQVSAPSSGSSQIELTVTRESDGSALFGNVEVVQQGRPIAHISAEAVDGAVRLTHQDYGSAAGFTIAYRGSANAELLGLASAAGQDVQGTIAGEPAMGSGRLLTGGKGTDVEGLQLNWAGSGSATTTLTFSRGIGALAEAAAKVLTDAGSGTIDQLTQRLDERIQQLVDRADTLEQRLERRREQLIRQFTAMEQAMSRAQTQSAWLAAQLSQSGKSK